MVRRVMPQNLFPNAKPAEDAIQNVIGVNGTGDAAEFVEREAEFRRDQLFSLRMPRDLTCLRYRFRRQANAVPAADGGSGDNL